MRSQAANSLKALLATCEKLRIRNFFSLHGNVCMNCVNALGVNTLNHKIEAESKKVSNQPENPSPEKYPVRPNHA